MKVIDVQGLEADLLLLIPAAVGANNFFDRSNGCGGIRMSKTDNRLMVISE